MKLTIIFVISSFVFGGCSLFEGEEKAEIRFTIQNFDTDEITIKVVDGRRQFQVVRNDFTGSENRPVPGSTDWYRTATKGTMHISFELADQDRETCSSGEFDLDLKEDWRWGVRLLVESSDYDPLEGCFGCITHYAFEINKDAVQDSGQLPDSLYVVVGGNYISEPVEY